MKLSKIDTIIVQTRITLILVLVILAYVVTHYIQVK